MPNVAASASMMARRLIQRRHVMTDVINAKSEALELHELSFEESGGDKAAEIEQAQIAAENKKQADALKGFQQLLQEI
jgi:hypothetical protein